MAGSANFTPDEWSRVLASPMVASAAITLADPSGLWGLLKEGMTGGWALLKAKQNANTNPLVKAVAEAFTNGDTRTSARGHVQTVFQGSEAARLKERAVEELRAVASIVDTKAPEDAAAFKSWLQNIAKNAAERSIPLPQVQVLPDRAARRQVLRQRLPLTPCPQHGEDCVEHLADVHAPGPSPALGGVDQRLDQRPKS